MNILGAAIGLFAGDNDDDYPDAPARVLCRGADKTRHQKQQHTITPSHRHTCHQKNSVRRKWANCTAELLMLFIQCLCQWPILRKIFIEFGCVLLMLFYFLNLIVIYHAELLPGMSKSKLIFRYLVIFCVFLHLLLICKQF